MKPNKLNYKIFPFFIITLLILSITNTIFCDDNSSHSQNLTKKAWLALDNKDFENVYVYADKCITKYLSLANKQQLEINDFPMEDKTNDFWALNDVATCIFIKARALREEGKKVEALKLCEKIMYHFPHAQCWDPIGWYWKVAHGARDQIIGLKMDIEFENCTSLILRTKALNSFFQGEYIKSFIYIAKCIEMYDEEAKKMQKALKTFASKEKAFDYWALNDVAMCFFIKGKILLKKGNTEQALKVFQKVIDEYYYAQYFHQDMAQFTKISELAKKEIIAIKK
ncbi:MAG: tetratricopeptide repeat protein [Candidatus Aureabacteria bacterium]|nr:tetratricopeptide repeat protein [Candidatus Auribacterota bacterium]